MATVKKNKKKMIIAICAVLVVAIAGTSGVVVAQKNKGKEATLYTISAGDIYEKVSLTGDVTSGTRKDYKVSSVATVKEVFVKVGDKVKKGDVLATFDVSDMETPVKDGTTKVCSVTSNASDEKLNLFVSIVIDDDMDTSSYLTIEAKHGEDVIAKAECTYHNGEGHEGEEGLCVADSDSEYIDTEVHDFLEALIDYIEEDLNPYVKQVAAMEYESGRHGGTYPVADFACQECGKDGVSITEDLLPIGKCCYCGYENEYYVCELCGTVYDDMGGDEHLCNGCMPRDD